MKEIRSSFLKFVAIALMLFPFWFSIGLIYCFRDPLDGFGRILVSPTFYLVCIMTVITGSGLWEVKRWAWYWMWFNFFMIAIFEFLFAISLRSMLVHTFPTWVLASFIVMLLVAVRIDREIRVPYFMPKLRWWESDPLYRISIPVEVDFETGRPTRGEILDIGLKGCFIRLADEVSGQTRVRIRFSLFDQTLGCSGSIVWFAKSAVIHPKGIGVRFGKLPRRDRRLLKASLKRLRKITSMVRRNLNLDLKESERLMQELGKMQRRQLLS